MKESIFTVPIRKTIVGRARWQRAKHAVKAIKEFVRKNTKAEQVKIQPSLNRYVWQQGACYTHSKIRVKVTIDDEKKATVDLF